MNDSVREAIMTYEESSHQDKLSIAVIVYNSDDNTATTATDMNPLEFATSITTALGSFLKQNNHEQRFVQDTIMNLLHRKGIEYSREFADALPTYDEFPRYIPKGEKTTFDETPSQIMARLTNKLL